MKIAELEQFIADTKERVGLIRDEANSRKELLIAEAELHRELAEKGTYPRTQALQLSAAYIGFSVASRASEEWAIRRQEREISMAEVQLKALLAAQSIRQALVKLKAIDVAENPPTDKAAEGHNKRINSTSATSGRDYAREHAEQKIEEEKELEAVKKFHQFLQAEDSRRSESAQI